MNAGALDVIILSVIITDLGGAMTKQRKLILEILGSTYLHPTAQSIYEEARKTMPNISLGTVYRNLGVLVDEGAIVRLSAPGLPDRFDLPRSLHWHVVCDSCGKVKDVPVDDELISRINTDSGEQITSYLLTAHCICQGCRKAAEND